MFALAWPSLACQCTVLLAIAARMPRRNTTPFYCTPAAEQQQLRGQRTADSSRLAAPPLLEAFARLLGALLPQARLEAEASAAEGAGG